MLQWLMSKTSALAGRGKLSILIYHQVLEQADPCRPGEPDANQFRWQMELVKKYFSPIALPDALEKLKSNSLPDNAICITFDDGYLNNLNVAQPILESLDIPATVYVATGFSNGVNMWNDRLIDLIADSDRNSIDLSPLELGSLRLTDAGQRVSAIELAIGKLKYLKLDERIAKIDALYSLNNAEEYARRMMSPDEVKRLSEKGINIGAHTVNHPILKVLDGEQQISEISRSKEELETWLGKPVLDFAYPNGVEGRDFDEATVRYVEQAGFRSAVVTDWGISNSDSSFYKLKRFTPWDKGASKFQLRLVRNLL